MLKNARRGTCILGVLLITVALSAPRGQENTGQKPGKLALVGGTAGTAPPYSRQLITDIVNAGRPVVITAAHRAWIYPDTAAVPERLQDPLLKREMSPEVYAEVQSSLKNWRALGYFGRTDREMIFREQGVKQFTESGTVLGMDRFGHADEFPHRGAVALGQGHVHGKVVKTKGR